jgi:hypothetical protein
MFEESALQELTFIQRAKGIGMSLEDDVGQRVVIRWRPPWPEAGGRMTDVLGILEVHSADSFTGSKASGQLVVIPRQRAVAGKVVPPAPARHRSGRPSQL